MMLLVGVEMLLGFGELLLVPFDRPNGWVIRQGEAVTLVHGALGGVLGFGALVVFLVASREGRVERIAAWVGIIGVAIGGIGGFFCYAHSLRLVGMILMFIGAATAFFGYLMPAIDDVQDTA
jgi:drug/metabolite transporter (DMT)-like permease